MRTSAAIERGIGPALVLVLALGLLVAPRIELASQGKQKSAGSARSAKKNDAAASDEPASDKSQSGKPQSDKSQSGKPKKSRRKKDKSQDAIAGVEDYASSHFVVHTDLTDAEAEELLDRLETMLSLISKYWDRSPSGMIEMYVVKDLKNWPPQFFPDDALYSLEGGAGVTITATRSSRLTDEFLAKSVVYAVADRGTPQHEAVHAYCGQTFGRTGPLWYSEGMAEMGQYWRANDSSVNAEPVVIRYLRESEPKSLNEIVNAREITGDSWQNYAWRWALCHLLANNTNYSQRFRPLGLGLLTKQDVSFEQTYGNMAKEISFEYRQFLQDVERGYRADLCSWDWKSKFMLVKTAKVTSVKIEAGRGWQASRLIVQAGEEYEFSAAGNWVMSKGDQGVDADGDSDGNGRLIGALLTDEGDDFALGEPFELGRFGTFTAPGEGNLFLRCREPWSDIADNRGTVMVKLKLKGKGPALTAPKKEEQKKSAGDKKRKGGKDKETEPDSAQQKPDEKPAEDQPAESKP